MAFRTVFDQVFQFTRHAWPPHRLPCSLSAFGDALVTSMNFPEHFLAKRRRDYITASSHQKPIYFREFSCIREIQFEETFQRLIVWPARLTVERDLLTNWICELEFLNLFDPLFRRRKTCQDDTDELLPEGVCHQRLHLRLELLRVRLRK